MNKIGDTLLHTAVNEELVRILVNSHVEFLIIGGLAVSWYCAQRQADDMDILLNPTLENSERVFESLKKLNMSNFDARTFTRLGLQVPLKEYYYAELLTPRQDWPAYSKFADNAVDAKLFNIPVRLASLASLIWMKVQAINSHQIEMNKHLKDIDYLSNILNGE